MVSKGIKLCFIDNLGEIIEEKNLTALSLRDESIIEKAIEFFDDPEPCMIHRSAVINRIFAEVGEYFLQHVEKGKLEILWNQVPDCLRSYINTKDGVKYVRVKLG